VAKTTTGKYVEGIGRRKTATARVRVFVGTGVNTVNDMPIDKYFATASEMAAAVRPFVVAGLLDKNYFTAKVTGGGVTGQSEAIQLGVARALVEMDEALRVELRKEDLLTRDPRKVERKKYGLKKARKKPQFSKR
jgi:small subunit ribosomal protein S9